jgi:GntR family transcriptional regulator
MTPRADDPRPPYVQVADVLRREIERGEYRPGQKLPSVRDLSERFGIAPMTVGNVLRVLREEGLVFTTPGRGTFVGDHVRPEPEATEAPEVSELSERVAALDAQVRSLSERLERLEAKG